MNDEQWTMTKGGIQICLAREPVPFDGLRANGQRDGHGELVERLTFIVFFKR